MTERKNPPAEFLYENKWRIFGVMMIGWAMSLLDVSIVNISIPELEDQMSTNVATVTWVINAYNIVFAVLLVSMGRLADQFGRRNSYRSAGMALTWAPRSSTFTRSESCRSVAMSTSPPR